MQGTADVVIILAYIWPNLPNVKLIVGQCRAEDQASWASDLAGLMASVIQIGMHAGGWMDVFTNGRRLSPPPTFTPPHQQPITAPLPCHLTQKTNYNDPYFSQSVTCLVLTYLNGFIQWVV